MTLFLVGGGPAEAPGEVYDAFAVGVGKRGGVVALILSGPEDASAHFLPSYRDPLVARVPDADVVPVWLTGPDTVWPDGLELDSLAGIVVGGGRVTDYLDGLMPRRDDIARAVRRGVGYLGLSAGAMVASKHAIAGGWRFQGRPVCPEASGDGLDELELRDGLALVGTTIETHADTGSTLGRALAALELRPTPGVVAIDETSALEINAGSGRTRAHGPAGVRWISQVGDDALVRTDPAARRTGTDADNETRGGRL